jgi:Predicted secreted protein
MEKLKMNACYPVILICAGILVLAGSLVVYLTYNPSVNPFQKVSGSPQNSGSVCNPQVAVPRVPVPADTSVPIQDPMPGVRYSLSESDSGRTIMLRNGDIFEITLGWSPERPFHWIIPVTGCGLELMNDGTYSDSGDFWNVTGYYRARYRAISAGTSILDGKYVLTPDEEGTRRFNLTVIMK